MSERPINRSTMAGKLVTERRLAQKVQVRMHPVAGIGRSGKELANVEGVEFLTHDGNSFYVYFDGLGGLTISIENMARTISVEPASWRTLKIKSRRGSR